MNKSQTEYLENCIARLREHNLTQSSTLLELMAKSTEYYTRSAELKAKGFEWNHPFRLAETRKAEDISSLIGNMDFWAE